MLPVVLLLTLVVFAPTLRDWFWADDFYLLRSSQTTPLGTYIVEAFDYRNTEPPLPFYRPLYFISFRLCYEVFGQYAWLYHAVNVALHLGSVGLVWVIARRILDSVFAANVAALFFGLHPAYTESVQFIARGNTVMVTFVYLLTMLAFIKYVDGGNRRWLFYVASIVGFAAGLLYHSTSMSLLAVLPAYVFLIVRRPSDARRPRAWLPFAPFAVIAVLLMAIQTTDEVNLSRYVGTGWHQYAEFGQYLAYALFPVLAEDWQRFDLPRQTILLNTYLVASVAMIGAMLLLLDRRWRRWPYREVFVVCWMLASLAPNTTQLLGARPALLYLPGAFLGCFFLLVAKRGSELLPANLQRPASAVAPLFLAVLVVGFVTLGLAHQRDLITQDNQDFIARLRESVPPLPEGSTVYVVDPPLNLALFNSVWLEPAVQLYYGDVVVRRVSNTEAARIRAADPQAYIFDNRP